MEIFLLPYEFEWDKYNRDKIKEKHNVDSEECEEVFFNLPLLSVVDVKHSRVENRYYILGKTNAERILFIVFTIRNKKVRVITARDANKKEKEKYHEAT
ncbi:MAG: BrnT family toxin [Elusimicrobiota bacterium]